MVEKKSINPGGGAQTYSSTKGGLYRRQGIKTGGLVPPTAKGWGKNGGGHFAWGYLKVSAGKKGETTRIPI